MVESPTRPWSSLGFFETTPSIQVSIRVTPTKLLRHFISRTFTFLLSALHIPNALAPYNAVGTIIPSYIDTSWTLFPVLYCSAHFTALPTLYTNHSFCVPHPIHILHQLPLATPVTKTIHLLILMVNIIIVIIITLPHYSVLSACGFEDCYDLRFEPYRLRNKSGCLCI